MKSEFYLVLCIVAFFIYGCSGKQSAPNNKNSPEPVQDTLMYEDYPDYTTEQINYSEEELNVIMDSLAKIIKPELSPYYNITGLGVLNGYIEVSLIDSTMQKINEFRKYIMNLPAIRFRQAIAEKPKNKECISCGFDIAAVPAEYTLPTESIKITIKNNLQEEGVTGDGFFIEYLENEEWKPVRLNYNFNSIGYPILPGNSKTFTIDLQTKTYNYKPGKYRIYKTISINKTQYSLIADFNLR